MRVIQSAVVAGMVLASVSIARGEGKVITVAKEGGDYKTIQAAIDAAPDGAVLRIAAGTWEEHLAIRKPLTLEGAGWERTWIVSAITPAARDAIRALEEQSNKGITHGELSDRTKKITDRYSLLPVVRVEGAKGVNLHGLKIVGPTAPYWDGSPLSAIPLVAFDQSSSGDIKDCAIIGSTGNGVDILNGSDVRVTHCLVGGVWGTGIAVGSYAGGTPAKAAVSDSDLRICYYAGATIAPKSDATIERCRIWGTAWHGIRYDDASPTIRGNLIYNIARLNIYASGVTHATISGNVITGTNCDSAGIWCLPGNRDQIVQNTFMNNTEAGIRVTGDAAPAVTRNLFYYQPVPILCGTDSVKGKVVGHPELSSNWIWPDPKETTPLQPAVDLTTHIQDPGIKSESDPYTLPSDSPARAAQVGAADVLSFTSDFPIQPQEAAIQPERDWDYQLWKKG